MMHVRNITVLKFMSMLQKFPRNYKDSSEAKPDVLYNTYCMYLFLCLDNYYYCV